jgi:hypothetical protein
MIQFRVDCPCGRHLMVTEGAAGAVLKCECGRRVPVPSLEKLRADAGLNAYDFAPEFVIEHARDVSELLHDRACVGCGAADADLAWVHAECEKSQTVGEPSRLALALGVLVSPLFFLAWFRPRGEVVGRDKAYDLPLPVCARCGPTLTGRDALLRALNKVPIYERLLEKFPQARLTRVTR